MLFVRRGIGSSNRGMGLVGHVGLGCGLIPRERDTEPCGERGSLRTTYSVVSSVINTKGRDKCTMPMPTIKEHFRDLSCILRDPNDVVVASAGATASEGVFTIHGDTSGVGLGWVCVGSMRLASLCDGWQISRR